MRQEDPFTDERAELAAVLATDDFTRSPNLGHVLRYICEQYFQGEAHKLKEYNIAVEALGRPDTFDSRRDSIVRVEVSRLRKRLERLYRTAHADHPVRITVPCGSYLPEFVRPGDSVPEEQPQPAEEPRAPAPYWKRPLWYAAAAVLLLGGGLLFAGRSRLSGTFHTPAQSAVAVPEPPSNPGSDEIRILAGSTAARFVDRYGNAWSADRYYSGGDVGTVAPRSIANTRDPGIYHQWRQGGCAYNIPLKKGSYELRLHFAETLFGENNDLGGGEWSRIFSVWANGNVLLDRFDLLADSGGSNIANVKVFKDIQPAADGQLHLKFASIRESAFVNAIEVLPSAPGVARPIRILARDTNYTDSSDRTWSGDRYARSGTLVQRHAPIAGTAEPALYQGERFGNFTYTIPVALNSRYSVTLRFCENWFGRKDVGGGTGGGSRVFDVYLNGKTLLEDFDVFRIAGSLHALDKTFRGVTPNAQGKLVFSFVPKRNYAMINGFEILDEAR